MFIYLFFCKEDISLRTYMYVMNNYLMQNEEADKNVCLHDIFFYTQLFIVWDSW